MSDEVIGGMGRDKAKEEFIESLNEIGGWVPPAEVYINDMRKQIKSMKVEIQDLFQRYGHALDRIISLEKKVHSLSEKANEEEE